MSANTMIFPVNGGISGMNCLAIFLNGSGLSGDWHFARGSRFDQTSVAIDFDHPEDMALARRRYQHPPPQAITLINGL